MSAFSRIFLLQQSPPLNTDTALSKDYWPCRLSHPSPCYALWRQLATSPLRPRQAVTDGVHDIRFRSCSTRNGAEERGLSAHVVFRRRKKERGLSAHVVASSFLLRVPQQLQPARDGDDCKATGQRRRTGAAGGHAEPFEYNKKETCDL